MFDSVRFNFYQKNNQTGFFKKKPKPNRNQFKPTGFDSVRLFWKKIGSNWFGSVFWFDLVFPVLLGFFPVLARFFLI